MRGRATFGVRAQDTARGEVSGRNEKAALAEFENAKTAGTKTRAIPR